MPQVVNPEPVAETGQGAGGQEDGAPPVRQPHDAAARHGEHEIIGVLAGDSFGELGGDEPGNRDGAGLMRLGRAQDDMAADVGKGTPDVDPTAAEVDVADS